ncbi:GDP-mannose 4,6-dehydratase [Spirochaetota bacterium]
MKKVIIVGCDGQDGRIAFDLLTKKKYALLGIDKECIRTHNIKQNHNVDIINYQHVCDIIKSIKPDEVYHFAAFHCSSEESLSDGPDDLILSYQINVFSLIYFLEAIKAFNPASRLFYSASSLIFEDTDSKVQDESTPPKPASIYGITKYDGLEICKYYRNNYNIFASCGIFYNHESKYRSLKFLSKKIITSAIAIKNGSKNKLVLGSLSSEADWGYAPDYVNACIQILNSSTPDDYIIATGKKHSVREFVETAFGLLGLDWHDHVVEDNTVIKSKRKALTGNPSKLKKNIGWEPSVSFKEMIKKMIISEGYKL